MEVERAKGRGCLTRSEPPVRLGQLAQLVRYRSFGAEAVTIVLSAAPVSVWIMEPGSKKFEQRVSRFLRPFLQDPVTGLRKNDYRHIVRDQLHLCSELVA